MIKFRGEKLGNIGNEKNENKNETINTKANTNKITISINIKYTGFILTPPNLLNSHYLSLIRKYSKVSYSSHCITNMINQYSFLFYIKNKIMSSLPKYWLYTPCFYLRVLIRKI